MNTKKADMVLTDPPYGISYDDKARQAPDGHSRGNFGPIMGDESIPDFESVLSANLKKLHPFYIFAGADLLEKSLPLLKKNGHISAVLVWMKNNFTISRMDYKAKHEFIIYGWMRGDGRHRWFGESNNATVLQEHWVGKERSHPTQKPVALLTKLINNSSERGNIVLDMFLGSGSTLIACEKQNRVCYGMELDPKYCDVIVKRWEEFTGQKAVKNG